MFRIILLIALQRQHKCSNSVFMEEKENKFWLQLKHRLGQILICFEAFFEV